jgi:uncharacterized protein (TIGR02271 family)
MSDSPTRSVISKDGVRGTLVDGLPVETATTHVLIRFETGQQVLVPTDTLSLQADGRYYYLALRLDQLEQQDNGSVQPAEQPYVVPVIDEILQITRQQEEIGRVVVRKHVHERVEVVDEPLRRDNVTVTHVPINRVIDLPVDVRQEGETLVVPVLEEVLVVEKRLMLVEEVHVTRHTTEIHQPEEVTLRREEVTVERISPPGVVEDGGMAAATEDAPLPTR